MANYSPDAKIEASEHLVSKDFSDSVTFYNLGSKV